jgi:hypothetical protein
LGTWTFGSVSADGNYLILLNGSSGPVGNAASFQLYVWNGGQMYTLTTEGS